MKVASTRRTEDLGKGMDEGRVGRERCGDLMEEHEESVIDGRGSK